MIRARVLGQRGSVSLTRALAGERERENLFVSMLSTMFRVLTVSLCDAVTRLTTTVRHRYLPPDNVVPSGKLRLRRFPHFHNERQEVSPIPFPPLR